MKQNLLLSSQLYKETALYPYFEDKQIQVLTNQHKKQEAGFQIDGAEESPGGRKPCRAPLSFSLFTHVETSVTFTSWRDITYNKSRMGYDYKLLALEIKSNCLKQNFPSKYANRFFTS